MKQMIVAPLIGLSLLLSPSTSHAGETRVYVGVGTAIIVGSGIASFNIGYSQRISKREPGPRIPEIDPPPALAKLKTEGDATVRKAFSDSMIHAPSVLPPTFRFEIPLFILRW